MERCVGGNGANTARALGILGTSVRLAGALGNDDAAEFVLGELRASHVDTSFLNRVPLPNAATAVLVNARGDRQFLHRLGSSVEVFAEPLSFDQELTSGIRHFHLASLFVLPHLRRQARQLLEQARRIGLSTSLDTNWDPHGEWMRVLEPCLPAVDFLFLNEDESRMLTHTTNPAEAAARLQDRGGNIIIQKLGSQGCAIFTKQGAKPVACPAFQIEAIDTTGAGDCFAAGFLSAYLKGMSLEQAGRLGNAAGALSVRAVGSVTGLLPFAELEVWMNQNQTSESLGTPLG
jgi:sugar/nucleoside kinase (ribokinase family)